MPQQFKLILTNRWKATALVLAIVVVSMAAMFAIIYLAARSHPLGALVGLLFLAVAVFLPERLARKFGAISAVVVIDDAGIAVQYGAAGPVRRINFADMASYSTGIDFDFTVRPQEGKHLKLHLNPKLHLQGLWPMLGMQQHFQWAVADYQRQYPDQPPIRDLGFFGRRSAIVWLCFFAILLAWLGWRACQPFATEGAWGGFLFGGLLFTTYALMWQHQRRQTT